MPPPTENKSELRRKKKSYYAALKKQEDTKLAELAEKYRDRARERRDGSNELGPTDPTSNTSSAYRFDLHKQCPVELPIQDLVAENSPTTNHQVPSRIPYINVCNYAAS